MAKEVDHFRKHQHRMDYRAARSAGQPIGTGSVEATCRQAQCRFKHQGQFWTQASDEALMCLETFWRNQRWNLLFPHTAPTLQETEMHPATQQQLSVIDFKTIF